ncbi:unnamed protein product [Polarella glacialis]|uniref:Uncharacterized protein n=1 Tax=Polarella glacialis TaxID=89957 RepID=A0A813EMU1_POLGL|nr:unnamed protein product [Polarella glacialis]
MAMVNLTFLEGLGVKMDIAQEIFTERDKCHREALRRPGQGGAGWKQALVRTMVRLMKNDAVLTLNVGRITKILNSYVSVQYADEHIPRTSMTEVAREAVEAYQEHEREKK